MAGWSNPDESNFFQIQKWQSNYLSADIYMQHASLPFFHIINLFSKSGLLNSNKSFVLNKLSITFPTKKGVTPLRQLHANFGSLKWTCILLMCNLLAQQHILAGTNRWYNEVWLYLKNLLSHLRRFLCVRWYCRLLIRCIGERSSSTPDSFQLQHWDHSWSICSQLGPRSSSGSFGGCDPTPFSETEI